MVRWFLALYISLNNTAKEGDTLAIKKSGGNSLHEYSNKEKSF